MTVIRSGFENDFLREKFVFERSPMTISVEHKDAVVSKTAGPCVPRPAARSG